MTFRVISEDQIMQYKLFKLDHDCNHKAKVKYMIKGTTYEPVYCHLKLHSGEAACNYIAIESTDTFVGETVVFI